MPGPEVHTPLALYVRVTRSSVYRRTRPCRKPVSGPGPCRLGRRPHGARGGGPTGRKRHGTTSHEAPVASRHRRPRDSGPGLLFGGIVRASLVEEAICGHGLKVVNVFTCGGARNWD